MTLLKRSADDDVDDAESALDSVPGDSLDPWTIDDRVTTQQPQGFHAESTTMKSQLFNSSVVGLAKVRVPFFVT